jgi:hypothetical protein
VGKSCSKPAPKKVLDGDYWTQHAKNFVDSREREMRPATAEASKEHVHKVAVGIVKEIKTAAFEDGNTTALKVVSPPVVITVPPSRVELFPIPIIILIVISSLLPITAATSGAAHGRS